MYPRAERGGRNRAHIDGARRERGYPRPHPRAKTRPKVMDISIRSRPSAVRGGLQPRRLRQAVRALSRARASRRRTALWCRSCSSGIASTVQAVEEPPSSARVPLRLIDLNLGSRDVQRPVCPAGATGHYARSLKVGARFSRPAARAPVAGGGGRWTWSSRGSAAERVHWAPRRRCSEMGMMLVRARERRSGRSRSELPIKRGPR